MVKGGIRTSEEKVEKKESKLAELIKKVNEVLADHEKRIQKLEEELW